MSFKVKLGVGIGIILAVFVSISFLNHFKLKTIQKSVVELFRGDIFAIELVSDLRPTIYKLKHLEKMLVLAVDKPSEFKKIKKEFFDQASEINDFLDLVFEDEHLSKKQREHIKKVKKELKEYVNGIKKVITATSQNKYSISQMNKEVNVYRSKFLSVVKGIEDVYQDIQRNIEGDIKKASHTVVSIQKASLWGLVISFVIAIIVGGILSYSIINPTKKMINFAKKVSEGDLLFSYDFKGKDELSQIGLALNEIKDTFLNVIQEFDRVYKMIKEGKLLYKAREDKFSGEYKDVIGKVNEIVDTFLWYLDKIPNPFVVVDKELNVLFMNQKAKEISVAEFEEGKNFKCYELFKFPQCKSQHCFCVRAMGSEEEVSMETSMRLNEKEIFLQTTSFPIKDEEGNIAGACSLMVDITDIKEAQITMQRVANEAVEISRLLFNTAEELSSQVEESVKGAEEQKNRVVEVSTSMEEMNNAILDVAKNSTETAEHSNNTKEKAKAGQEVVEEAVRSIFKVNELTEKLKENMDLLNTKTEEITGIINVINDIADQTNLLALNAAIEAARAGDAGRGFAVVADEVRKLAEKTMNATKEVHDAVSSIKDVAHTNLIEMEEAVKVVEDATSKAKRSGEVLKEIVSLAEESFTKVQSIATAVEEQSATVDSINISIEGINKIAAENYEIMSKSLEAIQELNNLALKLKEIIQKLQINK